MPEALIAPRFVFDGRDLLEGRALRISGGRIAEILPASPAAQAVAGIISPGFVDLQVNGGGGIMLNAAPTAAGISAIAAAHRRFGTVAVLPTVISDTPDVLAHAAEAALATKGQDGVIGLHIEGPHIAPARRGTHAAQHLRPLDDHTMQIVRGLRAADVPVMITLAPEAATPAQITALAGTGAVVSLGHTDADSAAILRAVGAGATCFTHLFNAMSQMQGRAAGAVGTAINSSCFAGIICDGHHVADDMLALAIRARPVPDRMFLVSDAMATVGGPAAFTLYGQQIALEGGRLVNAEGNLAGAHITQAAGVKRLVDHTGIALQDALRMAVSTPAGLIGRPDLGTLLGRSVRDVVLLGDDLSFQGDLAQALPPA